MRFNYYNGKDNGYCTMVNLKNDNVFMSGYERKHWVTFPLYISSKSRLMFLIIQNVISRRFHPRRYFRRQYG